jgi:hypothetical protein
MDFGFGPDVRTMVVCPSISFPAAELRKITGNTFYEERMLYLLLLLEDPAARVVYLTSEAIDPDIVDYYLGFLPDPDEARRRLDLLALDDPEERALSLKLLDRPDVVAELAEVVGDPARAFLFPFNVTSWEARLCERLRLSLYGAPVETRALGSKSGARRLARAVGVEILEGVEDLWSVAETEAAVDAVLAARPEAPGVVIKLNDGFSGQGNAILAREDVRSPLSSSHTVFCAAGESWESFEPKIAAGGAVVEEMLRSSDGSSPSVQMRVAPSGRTEMVSTHAQVLGGPDDQVYLGCRFPAPAEHRAGITARAERIGAALAQRGVVGPFGIDFLIAPSRDGARVNLSEINLRVGGTTHPFAMAQLASGARYDAASGELLAGGTPLRYVATDNLVSSRYVGLRPKQVVDAIRARGIAFERNEATGVTLHLLGALTRHGKMGATCIARTHEDADALYGALVSTVEELAGGPV